MSDEPKTKPVNKVKVYVISILLYLVLNGLVFETSVTLLENATKSDLFPVFPFTRVAFLILAILFAGQYITKKTGHHKETSKTLSYTKRFTLFMTFGFLTIGALASVAVYDDTKYEPIVIPDLRKQLQETKIKTPNFSNEKRRKII